MRRITLLISSATLSIACGGQLPTYHKAYQPPPPDACQRLDLGEGVSEYGAPIELNEEERSWMKKIKSVVSDEVRVSPRLIRLSRLILELNFRGCDTNDPELQGDLFAHVGLYGHVNQIRTRRWYLSHTHPSFTWSAAESMLKKINNPPEHLSVGAGIRETWSVGSAAHVFKYASEIELDPTPRFVKDKVRYRGKVLGTRIAQGLYVTLPDGSVQHCGFQRESREEHPRSPVAQNDRPLGAHKTEDEREEHEDEIHTRP